MATKIKTKFILNGTDNTLFEVNGYLYNTKKNKSFRHDYMLESKKYTIKKYTIKLI